jgi:serine protease Do
MKLSDLPVPIKSLGIAAIVAAIFTGGYVYHGLPSITEAHATNAPSLSAPARIANITLPNFADMVSQQGPAVVNISVSGTVKTAAPSMHGFPQTDPDDPFFEFFRRFQPAIPEGATPVQALGSGFIVKSDGVVLTNAHVVAEADEVTVKLTDKREFKAKVIGIDKTSDVAVLKIAANNLPTVKIGDPQSTRVGEWVVAIGSPFGFENSVTAGIVSAKSRSLPDEGYVPFLQTDVAINPGNSGGPLFNLNGEVIGINSQIYSRSGGYQGLSFAIPIDVAMKVEKQLLDHGKVSRGRLGVMIQPMTQELAASFGLDKPVGALVSEVEKGSPAEKAGIQPGDVILKFNGKAIDRSQDLPPLVADTNPGSTTQVELWRDKKSKTTAVRIAEMNTAEASDNAPQPSKLKLGLAVRPLTEEEKRDADIAQGLVVENVTDGPAARAGIRSGDVILSVNGEKISNVDQLRALVAKDKGSLALLVMRGERKMFVPIQIG